ncbi:sugar transferase [Mariniflexile aquimaris]|uniref:Sugar transferase n=1 Tax=Mariniflexile aquimaris TaxID=881009 RepID=A0ABW3BT25_9FLAO
MYRLFFKRFFDFILALLGFIIVFPVFVFITLYLTITNNGKPFFFQKRPGKNENIFAIIKFKSMVDKKDSNGNVLPDNERVTNFGTFIRKTSLDEIPQLINILKGDMSLVGPRPLRVHYLPYYTEKEKIRHTVRPGITGLAQISGRNLLSWDTKLAKDVEYVENLSFVNDLIILLKTVRKVFSFSDTYIDPNMLDLKALRQRKN